MHRIFAVILIITLACRPAEPPPEPAAATPAWSDASAHTERFVETNGVRLQVLDWGGSGPALILIHGYGDSPHVFDEIAPAFTNQFRVVAYARRGHGGSSGGESFSNATLAADLLGIMDSLGIAKASLAGWSMGGNEITAAAGSQPDRVEKIVYLDGAYDWSDPAFAGSLGELPIALDPPPAASASLEAFKQWYGPTWFPGVDLGRLEAHVRALANPQPDGSLQVTPDSANATRAFTAIAVEKRDYRKVKAPALAIYSEIFLSQAGPDSATTAAIVAWEAKHAVPFRTASQARIRKELKGVTIATVPGSHATFVFVSRDTVVSLMREFLK